MNNRAIKKILKIYLCMFCFFAQVSVAYVLIKIFMHFGINNKFISILVLIITIASFMGLLLSEDIMKNEEE